MAPPLLGQKQTFNDPIITDLTRGFGLLLRYSQGLLCPPDSKAGGALQPGSIPFDRQLCPHLTSSRNALGDGQLSQFRAKTARSASGLAAVNRSGAEIQSAAVQVENRADICH